ncbi:hypothetical protein ACJ72_03986 [Emergomyces africanus]|uniref:Isochorismatase-like domain-containing protein n=1 Tax=Emergomyces africanus TaxID=1955775 RepID=A0A1B7NY17_9EURO|nr:hypothetical protein ACJ72_03986 [Emergomyces africanus]
MKALVLIDLQNEFLDGEKGRFTIPDSSKIPLLENIRNLMPAFRSHGCSNAGQLGEIQTPSDNLIIWVRAEYSGSKTTTSTVDEFSTDDEAQAGGGDGNSHFLTGTHAGKTPCCSPGSHGSEFYPSITPLIDTTKDVILTKSWFSAFKETGLEDLLRARNVDEVYFAGLLSNVCILASVTDSIQHGATSWKTHVVVDCLGYLREKSHAAALAKLSTLTLIPNPFNKNDHQEEVAETVSSPPIVTSTFFHPHTALYYVNGSIPSWRVQLALHHKQIPTNNIRMYVMRTPKPTRTPAFLAINPRGKAPVFVDNDPARTRTYESLAILLYIEEYYSPSVATATTTTTSTSTGCNSNPDESLKRSPAPLLLPPREQRQKRADVLCLMQESEDMHSTYDALEDAYWAAKAEQHCMDDNSTLTPTSVRFERFVTCERPNLIQAIHDELAFWETHIATAHAAGKSFMAGTDSLSLADCAFYPILAYMVHRGFVFTERFQGLERYYEDMMGLECVKRARPEGWGDGRRRGKMNVFGGI